jgi:hypothetical protein
MKDNQDKSELTLDSIYNTVSKYGTLSEGSEVYDYIKENPRLIPKYMSRGILELFSLKARHQYVKLSSERKFVVSFEYYSDQSISDVAVQGLIAFDAEIFDFCVSPRFIHNTWTELANRIADEQHVYFFNYEDDSFHKEDTNYVYRSLYVDICTVSDLHKNIDHVLKAQGTLHSIIEKETKRLEKKYEVRKEVQRLRNL